MDNKIWNIALVGCGGMARVYRHNYTKIPNARLALLVDINEKEARDAAGKLNVPKWSTNFEDALAPDIDIVDISTPNHMHMEQAVAAMKAGKDVLLQKPIAPSLEEAEIIVQTARETGRTVGMYMSMFDSPLYYEVKKMIDAGAFGQVAAVNCRSAHRGGLRMSPTSWRSSLEQTGGGSFIQLTVHTINMVQWLLDDEVKRVCAFSKNRMCPNVGGDDVTAAACEFESGALGTLASAYCTDGEALEIFGTKGFISVTGRFIRLKLDDPYEGDLIKYDTPGEDKIIEFSFSRQRQNEENDPFEQHIAFVKAVQQGKPAPVPVEIGLRDLKIVKAIYRSAETKTFVEVD